MPSVIGVVLIFLLTGCAIFSPSRDETPDPIALAHALAGKPILGRAFEPSELPEQDLFELTPAMKSFVDQHTDGLKGFAKVDALHKALLLPESAGGRGITYSAYYTLTGVETFERRQANCLSFTLLYVAMARAAGLDAFVNEVDLPPSWDLRDQDSFLFLRHVNTKVKLRNEEVVIDLDMERYDKSYEQRLIPDRLARAQYYSNRGMELAATGDIQNAFLHLRKALQLNQRQSYMWSNFATLYRRQGFLAEAEAVYLHGLQVKPDDLIILSNLSGLYSAMGQLDKAALFSQRTEKHRNNNPYYLYTKANQAWKAGAPNEARALLRKATKIANDEARFYELSLELHQAMGDTDEVEAIREKLKKYRTVK
jgi:Tfp pilus assembly protein PilF